MRIGFDAKRAFLNNTGLGNYSRDTIRILSEISKENKYFLYTPSNKKNDVFDVKKNNIIIKSPTSLSNKLFTSYWRSKKIVDDLSNEKIDIYHGLTNELPIGIEKTNIKTVVTIHDLIFIRYPNLFKKIDRYIYYKKFNSACKKANKIIAVSEQTKKDIIKFFNIPENKIKVVYQGCNKIFQSKITNIKRKKIRERYKLPENYLLYVGSIEERKNLLTILKTIKEIPKQDLVIIGEGGNYKKKCINYIKENNLTKRVTLLKNLNKVELAGIYQEAEMLIYPSIFEGFGIPIIEALFSEIPVITSKKGCFSEAGGPTTKYIDPISIKEMKESILEIKSSKNIKEKMKKNGLIYVQKFTDEKIYSNIMEVYKNI